MSRPKKCILCIESKGMEALVDLFSMVGFDVISEETVACGLERLSRADEVIDIVVSSYDTKSPKNGLDLVKAMQGAVVPVVIFFNSAVRAEVEEAGAIFVDEKLGFLELQAAVQRQLEL